MKPIQILCLTFIITTISSAAPVDEQSHDSLYDSEDDVQVLTIENFKTQVENSSHAWAVVFYMGWCGTCQRFAPSWKALASDIFSWHDLVKLGAVACSDEMNIPLCREYDITQYPTVKYFHEKYQTSPEDLGVVVPKTDFKVDSNRHHLIDTIISEISEGRGVMYPHLLPYTSSDLSGLFESVRNTTRYAFLVVEPPQTYLGAELALDLHKTPDIIIRQTFNNNSYLVNDLPLEKFPGVVVMESGNMTVEALPGVVNDRKQLKTAIATFLEGKEIKIVEEVSSKRANSGKHLVVAVDKESPRALLREHIKKMGDVVFQMDLETAVRVSLKQEVATTKIIKDEKLKTLVSYLEILKKYFPFGPGVSLFLADLLNLTSNTTQVEGWKVGEIVNRAEDYLVFSSPQRYLGCEGSAPKYRGYPCSIWKLFHYLTVNSDDANSPREVLDVMYDYVKLFFGCAECSLHFQDMATKRNLRSVSSLDSAILWLWEAHNVVNERLAGDETEDPAFPKRQFPTKEACPECVHSNGSWNSNGVVAYLKSMYGMYNVRYIGSDTRILFPGLE